MSTPPDKLLGVRLKIERAKHHICDFEARLEAFRKTNPNRVVADLDEQTGEYVFRVKVAEPPEALSLIAGDVLHNLRSSLDHLAWQLVVANGGAPTNLTYFPIFKTTIFEAPGKYKSSFAAKVEGMASGAVKLMETVQPCQAGYDGLWKLHELDITDKHRLLLVIGYAEALAAVSIIQGTRSPQSASIGIEMPMNRVYDGAEIGRASVALVTAMNYDFNLPFEIAFGKLCVAEGEPVLPLVHQLSHLVDAIVSQFAPFL